MKHMLLVLHDDEEENKISVNGEHGFQDPWMDLGLLIEAVGLLTATCRNDGKIEHNGQPVDEYLKGYIDAVCGDYVATSAPHRSDS